MRDISQEALAEIIKETRIPVRLRKKLKLDVESIDWLQNEFVAVQPINQRIGVFLVEYKEKLRAIKFETIKGFINKKTGRPQPVICDLCYTWQQGSNAAFLSFTHPTKPSTLTFLSCADLQCSLNVRDKTNASVRSRAQLHEDLSEEQRINRLVRNLEKIMKQLF